jgi:C4-dicarboxylate transporter DctM subunit
MSPEIVGLIGIVLMLVFLFTRMWIAFAMAVVGFFGIVYLRGFVQAFQIAGCAPYSFIAKYIFTTLPMFILMGNIVFETGIASDLFYAAHKWIGQLRGGLGMASAIASAILGVVTDSLIAAITLGRSAVAEMRKYNYDDSLAASSVIGGASLASLIPPSVGFIIYGILTEQSIGKLYIAGVIPGIILTILIMFIIAVRVQISPHLAPAAPKTSFKEKIVSLKNIWAISALTVFIIVGIYAGIFTPTEAGAVGSSGAIIIGLISRRLTRKGFLNALKETGQMTAMVLLIMLGVSIFMKFMAISKLPFMLGDVISQLAVSRYLIFAAIIILYIILGMFTDIIASIILTTPILYPVIIALGFDPIWYGVVLVIMMELGAITPPIGLNVFVFSSVVKVPVETLSRGVWPFCVMMLLLIIILIIFPQLALWLPDMM